MPVIPVGDRPAMLAAATQGLPVQPADLDALIQQESQWNTEAPNGGLGQVLASTAQKPGYGMAPADVSTPQGNLRFAAQYLVAKGQAQHALTPEDWSNPAKVNLALASYNGGGDPNYVANVRKHQGAAGPSAQGEPMAPPPNTPGPWASLLGVPPGAAGGGAPASSTALGPYSPSALANGTSPLANPLVRAGMAITAGLKYTPVDYDPFKVMPHVG